MAVDLSKRKPLESLTGLNEDQKNAYKLFLEEVDYQPEYTNTLQEIPSTNFDNVPESQIEIVLGWINDYIRSIGNSFDNYESEHLKMANEHDMSVRFLSKYRPKDYDPNHKGAVYVNTLEIFDIDSSPEDIYALFKEFHQLIQFDEYLIACFYYQIDALGDADTDALREEIYAKIQNIYRTILGSNIQSMEDLLNNKQSWETKVDIWKSAEADVLTSILEHQRRLLFNSPFTAIDYNFTPISRDLSFTMSSLEDSKAGSVYDSFVTCRPSRVIPFIRIDRKNYTDNGRDTQYAIYSYSVGDSNQWKNFDENIDKYFNDLPNFNLQGDTLSFLIDIAGDSNYSEGVLSANGFNLTVPNEVNLSEIDRKVSRAVFDTFGIIVSKGVEVSVRLKTKFETVYNGLPMPQYIDPTLFQFYLLSDRDLRMYIDESDKIVGDKRKIRIENTDDTFFPNKENYLINFDISSPLDIYISGPDRAKAENYFNNVFRRVLHGYIIRQNNISVSILNQFVPADTEYNSEISDDESEQSDGQPRTTRGSALIRSGAAKIPKKSVPKTVAKSIVKSRAAIAAANKGMEFFRGKNDVLKKLISPSLGWSRKCQCERQPVLLTDDEVEAWNSMTASILNYKGKRYSLSEREVRNYILPDGRSINFTCPANTAPFIRLVRPPKRGKPSSEFYPCCWGNRFDENIRQEDIVISTEDCKDCTSGSAMVERDDFEDNLSTIADARQATGRAPAKPIVTVTLDNTKLTSSLIRFLNYGDLNERQQEYRIYDLNAKGTSEIIGKNSLMECLLLATGNKDYIKEARINIKTRENVLLRYRRRLFELVDPMTYTQEIYDITIRDIENEILNFDIPLTYRRHHHGLEELFKVHIYAFTIVPRKPNQDSDDFILEVPRYQVGHFKTLYVNRPAVIVVNTQTDPNNYNLVVSNTNSSKVFSHLTRYLHTVFTSTHETVSNVISKYYGTNLYSRINWENFFGKGKITGQDIDSFGKTRVFQIDNRLTLSVPPTQPINVPRISEYRFISEKECLAMFGEPDSFDDDGFWYSWFDFKDAIYVLVEHYRGETASGRIKDDPKFSLQASLFRSTLTVSDVLKERLRHQKACNALVQIIHWAWRLDFRPSIGPWWNSRIRSNSRYNKENILPKLIKITLPSVTEVSNSADAFKWASTWWPEVFSAQSSTAAVYPELYDKLTMFFRREAEVMEKYIQDSVPPILFKIYENSADYPEIDNRIIFTTKKRFSDWIDNRSHTSSKFYSKIPTDLSVFNSISPVRILHWNRVILLQNVASRKYEDALYVAAYWSKYHVNQGYLDQEHTQDKERIVSQDAIRGRPFEIDASNVKVTVYAVSKIMTLVPYDRFEPENPTDLEAYVVVSPTGRYAALLM